MQKVIDNLIFFIKQKDPRRILFSTMFALLFAILFEYGNILTRNSGLSKEGLNLLNLITYFIVAFTLSYYLFGLKLPMKRARAKVHFNKKRFFIIFLIIFICYLPVFLAYYPGIFQYDVLTQIQLNTTQHPLVHTLFIRFFTQVLGEKLFHNHNIGIALATLTQMTIVSGIFSYAIERMRMLNIPKTAYVLLIVFFSLCPTFSIMAISTTKDTLFASFLLLSIIFFFDIIKNKKALRFRQLIPFTVSLIITCLLRNNMIYVAAIWLIVIIILFPHKKLFLISGISSLLICLIIQSFLQTITFSTSGNKVEMFAVPIQTLSKLAIEHPELIDDYNTTENLLFPNTNISIESLKLNYNPILVDPLKFNVWEPRINDHSKFIKKWLKYSFTYPTETLDTWAKLTVSSWYIFSTDYNNVYNEQGYLETGFINVWDDSNMNSKIPWLKKLLDHLIAQNNYQNNFVLFIIMSPALYIWTLILLLFISIYTKNQLVISLATLLLLLFITILLGPTIIIRYIYPIMISTPIILYIFLFWNHRHNRN